MSDPTENDVQAIHEIREQTMHAENAGDADFFDTTCTDDVVVMAPNMPAVSGREATVGFMREFLGHFELDIRYVSEETRIHGDFAYDRGTYSQTLTPKAGGPTVPEKGKFLWLYARTADGTWKIARVMWNASGPPA